jgi:hypothetical protein
VEVRGDVLSDVVWVRGRDVPWSEHHELRSFLRFQQIVVWKLKAYVSIFDNAFQAM